MSFLSVFEVDKMSVSVSRDERPEKISRPCDICCVSEHINQYWEPAIEELGIRCFIAPTYFRWQG